MDLENYIEKLAEEVHNAWMKEKFEQGFHSPNDCTRKITNAECVRTVPKFTKHCNKCHTDLYPYTELPENIKEYDRVTVRAVLNAIKKLEH
ncbi:MAG: RyR domain-containing protein [Parabacteroides sp.]|nr:RyR domain-containing protein [Parabacteroides sp.]